MNSAPPASLAALADQCVQCGLCLPVCPTYRLDAVETESPRGRIVLARALAGDRLPADDRALDALDHCLGCRACESACPARVDYHELLRQARQLTRSARRPPWRLRLLEWLTRGRRRLAVALHAVERLRRLWPPAQRSWPQAARPPQPGRHPAEGAPRGRVLLLEGCLARHWDARAHHAAIAVLTRLGWDVDIVAAGCCGSLHAQTGDADTSAALQRSLRQVIADCAADHVVLAASGCFEGMRQASAQPVSELMSFLADDPELAQLRLRPAKTGAGVAVHTPCSQRHPVKRATAAAQVLQGIAGLQLAIDAPVDCCGAAGSHQLRFPQRAAALRQPLLNWATASGLPTLCSSNIGCRLHLQAGLDAVRCVHPIEILADHLEPPR